MKKVVSGILALLMAASFTACANTKTSEETKETSGSAAENLKAEVLENYKSSVSKLNSTKTSGIQYDMGIDGEIKMNMGGKEFIAATTGNIKIKTVDGKIQCAMIMDIAGDDVGENHTEIYTDGEKIYYEVNGEETEMDMDTLKDQLDQAVVTPNISKDIIKDVTVEEDGENTKYTMAIDGLKLGDLGNRSSELPSSSIDDIGLKNMVITFTVNKSGDLLSMTAAYSTNMTLYGEVETETTAVFNYTINHSSDVEIDLSKLSA